MSSSKIFLILFLVNNGIVYLHTQYAGTPQPGAPLQAALTRTFELKCEYTGPDDNGEFFDWYKQNSTHDVSIKTDKPGHYVAKYSAKETTLLIKIFVKADADVRRWYIRTNKSGYATPPACQFGQIAPIPSPQSITDDKGEVLDAAHGSIRRSEGQKLLLICAILPEEETSHSRIQWEYSKDDHTFTDVPSDVTISGKELQIDSVQKEHRGYYRCTLNGISFTVLLRVKDKLAALWPFLGIIGVVLALVIIILIFERRQKANKKSITTDDDEQDHATDPLVRTTTRQTDNDNKKRAVKA